MKDTRLLSIRATIDAARDEVVELLDDCPRGTADAVNLAVALGHLKIAKRALPKYEEER